MGSEEKQGSKARKVMEEAYGFLRDPNLLEYLLDHIHALGLLGEEANAATTILVGVSAKTEDPINLDVTGVTSVGKSVIITYALSVFGTHPSGLVIWAGKLSKMSLIHDYGLGKVEMKKALDKSGEEIEVPTGRIFLDLGGLIIVLMEADESKEFVDLFRPILSHDKKEISFRITDRKAGGGLSTKEVVVRGWPVVVTLGTQSETREEQKTRRVEISPIATREKYYAVNIQDGLRRENPFDFPDSSELEEKSLNIARALNELLPLTVLNPFGAFIGKRFPYSKPRSQRDQKRLQAFLESSTILHQKQRIVCEIDGKKYVVATIDDYKLAVAVSKHFFEATYSGISQDTRDFFERVIKPLHEERGEGFTITQMLSDYKRIYGSDVARSTLVDRHVNPLRNMNWIWSENEKTRPIPFKAADEVDGLTEVDGLHIVKPLEDENWQSGFERLKVALRANDGLTGVVYKYKEYDKKELPDLLDSSIRTPLIRQPILDRIENPSARYKEYLEEKLTESEIVKFRQSVNSSPKPDEKRDLRKAVDDLRIHAKNQLMTKEAIEKAMEERWGDFGRKVIDKTLDEGQLIDKGGSYEWK